jgi:hypothetical protein
MQTRKAPHLLPRFAVADKVNPTANVHHQLISTTRAPAALDCNMSMDHQQKPLTAAPTWRDAIAFSSAPSSRS